MSRLRARLIDPTSGAVVAARLEMPRTPFGRGVGLMFRSQLAREGGMWIRPCKSIHMFWMRFAIDAVFLDRQLRIVRIVPALRPWRMVPFARGAHSVVELASGRAAEMGIQVGAVLAVEPVPASAAGHRDLGR